MAGKYGKRKRPVGRKPPAKRRKFMKKKPRYVPKKPISMGVEVYRINLLKQTATDLVHLAGSETNGPANSKIYLGAMWNRHSTTTRS